MARHPDDELVFLPLGGSNEIGMNFNLYGFGPPHARKWIVVDLGVTFGDQTTPGVEVIMPDPTYIEAYVHHFARGQFAIISVCVAAEGTIAEARVVESSADKAFDEAALVWARQAHYRPQLANGQPVYGCREVRVEINPDPAPRITRGADSALG